ncbi:MAG: fatty acid CoA ligase family protein [Gammaproteobacteria bacterium]
MITANIASHLPAMAKQQPDTLAVAVQRKGKHYLQYTYRQLDEASDRIARGLQEIGIVKGTRTVLMVKPSLDFFALVFALFKVGAVLVAVDPGIGIRDLGKCLAEAEPDAFIGIKTAHIARLLFGWARKTLSINVIADPGIIIGRWMCSLEQVNRFGSGSDKPGIYDTQPGDMAAILFTSGSTGVPKGVIYTHANFTAQVNALQDLYQIQPGEIDVATFPLFALFAPAMGMTSVIPDMDFTRPGQVDPVRIFEAIDNFGATTMFGSPALLNRVGRYGIEHNKTLPSLRRVLSAGAPVPAVVIERFKQMLNPDVQIFTPYGATESLPVSSIGSDDVLGETRIATERGKGVCVGKPVDGLEVKVIKITDTAIPQWRDELVVPADEIGEIAVKGPQVTGAYYNRPQANELAKIMDGDNGFWHRMGDIGYIDAQGRLWFCGRKSQRVITEHGVLFTIPCEGVFNVHPGVFRTALVGVTMNNETVPVLCVELEAENRNADHDDLCKELIQLGSQFEHTRRIGTFLVHPAFPVDIRHNAKISRKQLAQWAQEKLL